MKWCVIHVINSCFVHASPRYSRSVRPRQLFHVVLARLTDSQRHGNHRATLWVSRHPLPHSETDLGVDFQTAFLGLNVLLQCRASFAQTHQRLFRLMQLRFQHADRFTKLLDLSLQSAKNTTVPLDI